MISNFKKELNDIKNNAKVCIDRQKDIINKLASIGNSIMTNENITTYSLCNKIRKLHINNFKIKNETKRSYNEYKIKDNYTYWLGNAYRKCYGDDYEGEFIFKFDEKKLAKKLLNTEIVEKEIYTNIVAKVNDCTWRDENPYFNEYKDFYYPIKVKIYCNENFDNTKIYSQTEIENLIKNKKIIAIDNYELDEKNKVSAKRLFNIGIIKQDFNLKNIFYKKEDNVKVETTDDVDDYSFLKLENGNINLYQLQNIFSYIQYNKQPSIIEKINKTINAFNNIYPNFTDEFNKTIKESYVMSLKLEQNKKEFLTEYAKHTLSKYIKQIKNDMKKISREISEIEISEDQIEIE